MSAIVKPLRINISNNFASSGAYSSSKRNKYLFVNFQK